MRRYTFSVASASLILRLLDHLCSVLQLALEGVEIHRYTSEDDLTNGHYICSQMYPDSKAVKMMN